MDSWPAWCKYPLGHYVKTLGEKGDKATETEVRNCTENCHTKWPTERVSINPFKQQALGGLSWINDVCRCSALGRFDISGFSVYCATFDR